MADSTDLKLWKLKKKVWKRLETIRDQLCMKHWNRDRGHMFRKHFLFPCVGVSVGGREDMAAIESVWRYDRSCPGGAPWCQGGPDASTGEGRPWLGEGRVLLGRPGRWQLMGWGITPSPPLTALQCTSLSCLVCGGVVWVGPSRCGVVGHFPVCTRVLTITPGSHTQTTSVKKKKNL